VRSTFLSLLLLSSCLEIGMGSGSNGTVAAAATPADAGADSGPQVPSGCVLDTVSRQVLCTETALCPSLRVDHDLYPNCGFKYPSTSIEVLCVCDDALCPLGSALDCKQASALLDAQSELLVCIQRSEARCALRTH